MHFHLERDCIAKSDCAILSLSWMGRVPNELIEEGSWRLNRSSYYQEGWLATGNARAIAGVTFTSSHSRKHTELPVRTNYNLRGHRSQITLVRWNEPYQKLATCDSSGIIFVWIKYEGRWSIELINDRSTPVTHFSWSHDGRMALICYQDGFVLVGSVAGQRYWSSNLRLSSNIVCGTWTPDDQQVFFGSLTGQLIVMDVHGAMVSNVTLLEGTSVLEMGWNCEKFKMEERDEASVCAGKRRQLILAVSFENGVIHLMNSYDDVTPLVIRTGLRGVKMEWCNNGELLAVAGDRMCCEGPASLHHNLVHFYTSSGELRYCSRLPFHACGVTALTWGHNDRRLFVATGPVVHVAWIGRRVAPLQLLCRLRIKDALVSEEDAAMLPLPRRVKMQMANLFSPTLRSHIPDSGSLRQFIAQPPEGSTRLHCTMIRNEEEYASSNVMYTLYLEYFGGLIPLLKGKRTSKIRPEFIIVDPTDCGSGMRESAMVPPSDSSDAEEEPRTPRPTRRRWQRHVERGEAEEEALSDQPELGSPALAQVTSNIWGTKFRVVGLVPTMPAELGQVSYKTSLLHLQPRQMTLVMAELSRAGCGGNPGLRVGAAAPRRRGSDEEDGGCVRHMSTQSSVSVSDGGLIAAAALPTPRLPRAARPPPPLALTAHQASPPACNRRDSRAISRDSPRLSRRGRPSASSLRAEESEDELRTATRPVTPELTHLRESLLRMKREMDAKMRPEAALESGHLSKVRMRNGLNVLSSPRRMARSHSVNRGDRCHVVSHGRVSDGGGESVGGELGGRRTSSAPAPASTAHTPSPKLDFIETSPTLPPASEQLEGLKFIDDDDDEHPVAPRNMPNRSQSLNFISGHAVTLDIVSEAASTPQTRVVLVPSDGRRLKRVKSHSLDGAPAASWMEWLQAAASPQGDRQRRLRSSLRRSAAPAECAGRVKRLVTEELRGCQSSPVTPVAQRKERKPTGTPPISRRLLSSPLLCRRRVTSSSDSSDDEITEVTRSRPFTNLESLQRTQVKNKFPFQLRRGGVRDSSQTDGAPQPAVRPPPAACRQLIMHNIAPLWNESSQVYQLDFGGRVTQESAKNFQIQYCGDQVMQFGRIDGNAYTLDFQYPFSAVQAFAVALANVTQRFK